MKNILSGKKKQTTNSETAAVAKKHPDIEYHIDAVNPQLIAGWVCRKHGEEFKSCKLALRINGKDIKDMTSNMPREDLAKLGYGDGLHGFEASLNWQKFEVGHNELELIVDDTLSSIHEFTLSQKEMMVAMSDHICRHVDESMMQLMRNLADTLDNRN
ncbi:hypothetical protein ACFO4O_12740 [Glaciecola siphonariae]|uniref:Uncharacterized protein n=1 Tax=Glaciecola siphonariae TaxID=521012 RepID=A0ABV9LX35_9ALTE